MFSSMLAASSSSLRYSTETIVEIFVMSLAFLNSMPSTWLMTAWILVSVSRSMLFLRCLSSLIFFTSACCFSILLRCSSILLWYEVSSFLYSVRSSFTFRTVPNSISLLEKKIISELTISLTVSISWTTSFLLSSYLLRCLIRS